MAPQRPRAGVDDSRSETSSTKEKAGLLATSGVSKSRRVASSNMNLSSNFATKGDSAFAKPFTNGASAASISNASESTSGINWLDQPLSLLQSYRHAYHLPIPSAFTHPQATCLLIQGIGRHSPTMVASRRAKRAQRTAQPTNSSTASIPDKDDPGNGHERKEGEKTSVGGWKEPKEQLAMAVRRHFNAMGLNEGDTMVRFAYVASQSGRDFRLRFRPS